MGRVANCTDTLALEEQWKNGLQEVRCTQLSGEHTFIGLGVFDEVSSHAMHSITLL